MSHLQSIFAASALFLAGGTTVSAADRPFMSPFIQTSEDAISVAHALVGARNRTQHSAPTRNEAYWQKNFQATYTNGVWDVRSKAKYSPDVGGVVVQIAAQDGRVLSLVYCHSDACPPERVAAASAPVGHWARSQ
jgi:hypothetical protein